MINVNVDFSKAVFTDIRADEWELDSICLPNILILKRTKDLRNFSGHKGLSVPFENLGMFSVRNLSIYPKYRKEK